MKKRKNKNGYILLCALMATIVVMSLVVLPHAATEDSDPSASDSQSLTSETPASSEEATASPEASDDSEESASPSPDESASSSPDESASPSPDESASPSPDESVSPSTSESVSPSPSESPTKTDYSFENDDIIVTAVLSDAEAFPDNAEFCVTPITAETDSKQYTEVEAKINENVEADNQTVTDFLAYDIYFMADGARIEPELGNVTVTIQYKNQPFDEATEEATEEIKVLHLEETEAGVQVKDVTQAVDLLNIGFVETPEPSAEVSSEGEADSELSAAGTVKFVTESFSTFVVTGVSTGNAKIDVTMNFLTTAGAVDTSVSGTYYLYVENTNYNGCAYRNTLQLTVSSGVATASITGLYDQNGNPKSAGTLYPIINSKYYTAVLFKNNGSNTVTIGGSFKWDPNNYKTQGYEKYELNSEIADNYSITAYSSSVAVSNKTGSMAITATAKTGTKYSGAEILSALSPIRPYAVFATQFDITSDMEGSIAVQKANLCNNFGNSSNNTSNYNCSTLKTITVNKTYNGTTAKTFTYGLYKAGVLVETATMTLTPSAGVATGTLDFTNLDSTSTYTVSELGDSNTPLAVGGKYDGYTLTSQAASSSTSSSTINNTSYIQTILSSGGTPMRNGTSALKNCLVVGSAYTVKTVNNSIYVYSGSTPLMSAESAFCNISAASGTFPIDFATTLSSMASLSANLATALTSDTVMVKNMTIAEFNAKTNSDLTYNTNGKILLLNIDASGQSCISFTTCAALVVNGASCAGWSTQANNVIVNVYTKSGTTYSAYTGSISNAGFVMGTLLAPRASVTSLGQNFNGNICAAYVNNCGGEVHGNTMGTTIVNTVYQFVNTAILAIVLPQTGGIGTYIFYGVGGGIILLAAVLMIIYRNHGKQKQKRKRMRKRNGPSE